MRIGTYIHYALKSIAYTLCAIGCFYQIISILNIYFSFPTTVFSFVEIMDKLELPAISICNNNRVLLSKLKEFDQNFNSTWTKLENIKTSNQMNRTKLLKQKLIDKTIRVLMDKLSVVEFAKLSNSWEDFVAYKYFKCATDPFHLDKKCMCVYNLVSTDVKLNYFNSNYANVIESIQELGNCFTIFRQSNQSDVLKKIAIKSGLSQSPVIRGVDDALNLEISDHPFHPNEIFRIMINYSIEDRTSLNKKTTGFIMIHDENELPPIREKFFMVYPGYYYEFYINKETGKYLTLPYSTDCVKYDLLSTKNNIEKNGSSDFISQILSRESCIQHCMALKTVDQCQCWPPELPYIIVENSTNQLKWCSWRDGINIGVNKIKNNKSIRLNWFNYCFAKNEKECKEKCKKNCKIDSYEIIKQRVQWPSNERIERSKVYDMNHRKCCTLISVRFWSDERLIQQYEPKYEVCLLLLNFNVQNLKFN